MLSEIDAAIEADIIEIRADYLERLDCLKLDTVLNKCTKPVITTIRRRADGGKYTGPENLRLSLLSYASKFGLVDIEIDSADCLVCSPEKRIISYHNFEETPDCIEEQARIVLSKNAKGYKIITFANTYNDNSRVLGLLKKNPSRNLTAFCMGEKGFLSRILALSFGSFMTYAAAGQKVAPGQPTLKQLKHLYQSKQLNAETRIAGVIGQPVSNSLSPLLHNALFLQLAKNYVYLPFEVDNLDEFVKSTKKYNLAGFSVTMPHKQSIMSYLDSISEDARAIGAVNTVVIQNGRWHGENTDWIAIAEILKNSNLKDIVVLGAGGAARAVLYALKRLGCKPIVLNYDLEQGAQIARLFECKSAPFETLKNISVEAIINCTPVGMSPNINESLVNPSLLKKGMLVMDCVYKPAKTKLLMDAEAAGCQIISGLQMFMHQAARQFELWTNIKPDIDKIWEVLQND
jgi:3-dehydroquinate dehydratase / shikimate dehydrogenase